MANVNSYIKTKWAIWKEIKFFQFYLFYNLIKGGKSTLIALYF